MLAFKKCSGHRQSKTVAPFESKTWYFSENWHLSESQQNEYCTFQVQDSYNNK